MTSVEALPSCPWNPSPQQRTLPVSSKAQVWLRTAANWRACPPTLTSPADAGVSLSPMVWIEPLPSWP